MIKYLLVFLVTAMIDYGWSVYIVAVAQKRASKAALWSAVIYLIGSVNIILAIEDRLVLIPGTLGTLLGTYLAVKWSKHDV